jgi:ABC-type uncharacterized transport system involved in gliding motility auxiliary subunit
MTVNLIKNLNKNIIWFALLLFLMNSLVFLLEERLIAPFRISLYCAIAMLLYYFLVNAYPMIKSLRKRSVRESIVVFLLVPVLFGMFSLIYMISSGHRNRYDLTVSERFTLSEQTIRVLSELDIPVEVFCFYKDGQPNRDILKTGLEQYSHVSDQFSFEFIDPDRYPMRAREFGIENYGEMIVQSERGSERIKNATDEQTITNAILKATSLEKKIVYFVVGHGQADLEDNERLGYSLLSQHLRLDNYDIKPISLIRIDAIPADAACIVLSSGKTDLFDEEIELLRRYVTESEGSLLIMADRDMPVTMRELIRSFGVEFGRDVIIDKMSQLFGANYDTAVITQYGDHDITRKFTVASFFPTASSLKLEESLPEGFHGEYLAYSAQGSWAETDLEMLSAGKAALDKNDIVGPVPVGVVLSRKTEAGGEAKIVIFSDADFVSNTHLRLSGNKDLFLNTIAWLAGDEALISIRPKEVDSTPLLLRKSQSLMLFLIPVVFMPLLVIIVGIVFVVRRRQ